MAAGNDQTNRANNQDDAEEVKPPKKPAPPEIDASDVADEGEDLERAKRDAAQNSEAEVRQNGAASQIELAYLGVEQPYGPEAPPHAFQTRESIELKTKPLSAEDSKLLASGRQRFFEPGMDERARLVSLRDSFDALAASRGAASSKDIIREGRNLLGLSHYIKISDALTSVDGRRSLDPQKEAQAAQNIGQALGEIKRLAGASPRGNSAVELQSLLGGREGVDALMAGLSSREPAERDKALQAIAKAITGGDEWSADNVLTRAFHEKRQSYSREQLGEKEPLLGLLGSPRVLDVSTSAINPADAFETALNNLHADQIEARNGMRQYGYLDDNGRFQFNRGDKVVKPDSVPERVSSVTPYMLNPHLMLTDHASLNLDRAQSGAELTRRLLQPRQLDGHLTGTRFQRLDGSPSLFDPDSNLNPFGKLTTRFLKEEVQAPPWLPAAESVRDLSNASNLGDASRALSKLGELAQSGDKHAQAALATTLLTLTNGEKGVNLARQSISGSDPVFNPDLSRLDANTRNKLQELAWQQLTGSGLGLHLRLQTSAGDTLLADLGRTRPADGLIIPVGSNLSCQTKEVLTCLAIALASNPSTATEAQRSSMQEILTTNAGTDNGAYAIMNVLGTLGSQRSEALEQMLVSNLTGTRGDYFLDYVSPSALKGNETAIGILARTVGKDGMEPEKTQRAYDALMRAAQNGHADLVVKTLLEQNARYGDDGNVLNCLGAIAQDGKISSEKQEQIANVLRTAIASGDPDTHESAIKGFMRLSSMWSAADLKLIADNVCETTAEGLKGVINIDSPEMAKLLANRIINNLQNGSYNHIRNQTGAVTALGVLADYAPVSTAATIKDAINAQRFSGNSDADKLTVSGVNALMRIAGSRGASSELALDALRESGFPNTSKLKLEQASVRNELADFVTGAITRAEMSPETRAATFDSQFPVSLQGILREHGIDAVRANELVDKARNHYDDDTIRSVMERIELYNTLPPQLRARITEEHGAINQEQAQGANQEANQTENQTESKTSSTDAPSMLLDRLQLPTVFQQMANGKLEESENSLLLDSLETKVRNLREVIGIELRAASEEFQTNENRIQESFDSLAKHTAKGITTWEHMTSGLRLSSAYHEFILNQEAKLDWYKREVGTRAGFSSEIERLSTDQVMLTVALDAAKYQRLRDDGKEDEADRLALSMFQHHGPTLAMMAPDIWKDLGMVRATSGETVLSTKDGETIWQRLHRQGHAKLSTPPALVMYQEGGLAHAIKELSIHRGPAEIDGNARRQMALLAMDTDPRLTSFKKTASDLQTAMPELNKLLQAGLQGTRGTQFVSEVRAKAGVLEDAIKKMNTVDGFNSTPLQRMKDNVQMLRDTADQLDPAAQSAVWERINALEKVVQVFDANSQTNKNVRLLLEKINSNDFSESGFLQWLQGDGIKTVVAVTAAVAAAAFAVATFGAGTPLAFAAVVALSTAGGMVGYEVAAESLHHFGGGDRTGSQLGHWLRGGLVDGENGNARQITLGDVAADYGSQFVKGAIISAATMGAGAALGKGFQAVSRVLSRASTAETQALARLGARAAQFESTAEKLGGQELRKRWMERFAQQFRSEIGQEMTEELVYEKGAGLLVEKFVGESNPALSIFTSALIANRKGLKFDLHPRGGGTIDLELDDNTSSVETMTKLKDQMLTDGLEVEWNGQADSPMTVKTPEGQTIKINPRAASEIAAETDAVQENAARAERAQSDATTAADNLELLKHSMQQLDAPAQELDRKAARLGHLETSLKQPGNNLTAEERSAREAEIEKLKLEILTDFKNEAATQLSRSTGLAPDAARAIVDGLKIEFKPYDAETTSAGNLNSAGELTLFVGGDMPPGARPHKAFVHEFSHLLDTARYTALHTANPSGFINALVDNTVSNSFTGKTGIWDQPGAKTLNDMLYTRLRAGQNGLTDADVNFARETLSNYLRQSAANGRLPHTPSQKELADWIKDKGRNFPDSKHEDPLLSEMVREISHANRVFFESQLGPDAMQNPALQHMVAEIARSQSADPIVLSHMMRGISDATTAMVDSSRYEFGSRYENRAMRLQARSTIEATQNAMPALTSRLQKSIKDNPEFAALNAELGGLLGVADGTSNRRAGVRQSEYFASPEGQAQLARLKQNSDARWVAEQISDNIRTRQTAISTQRYLTALDTLPVRRAQLDASTGEAAVKAEQELQSTLQSLFANGKPQQMAQLIKFLGNSGLASGDQTLTALTANASSNLSRFDNATVSQIVQSLEATGMKRADIMQTLIDAGAVSPSLAARLPELNALLPPPVEVQLADMSLKEKWLSTLDTLSKFDTISRFNIPEAQTAVTGEIEKTVADWKPARQELDDLRLMQDQNEHAAKQEAALMSTTAAGELIGGSANRNTKPADDLFGKLTSEVENRAEALSASFNQTLSANNLPSATITVASIGNGTNAGANIPPARFNPETGTIEVSPELLLTATPGQISSAVRLEYEKALAFRAAADIAANQNSSQADIDAARRVNEMFAVQAASQVKVQELSQRAEVLADNTRLVLSEHGVECLMKRMSAPGANVESILGVAPPVELSALIAKFQQAQKRNGTIDRNKWPYAADQEVSQLLFASIYRASVQARSDLQRARLDRPPTRGELAFDQANLDNASIDAAADTNFSLEYGAQAEQRTQLAKNHSWAVPDRASLSALHDFAGSAGIVEIGAGKGIWAKNLRLMGVNVAAYDIFANNMKKNIYHHGEAPGVLEGGTDMAANHSKQTLLLSYPPAGETMGADALKAYTAAGGTRLAFIGDRPSPGSNNFNTGDQEFHQILDNDWVLKEVVELPHLPDGYTISAAKMYLYERRGATTQTADTNVETNTDSNANHPIEAASPTLSPKIANAQADPPTPDVVNRPATRMELLKESKLPDRPPQKRWGIGQEIQLDPATGEPVDPALREWFKTAKERIPLDEDRMPAFTEALANGKAKFAVLDRKMLEALEVEQDIFSFEQGNESNRKPYKNPDGSQKVPLQHANQYNPEADVEPAIIVKGQVNGRDRYFVINGCKRIQVFGSQSLNPDNKSLKVVLFEDAATFENVVSHDPRASFRTATPFFFETD